MDVETVSTADQSLLGAVRQTLAGAEVGLLCVAFVHSRGVHLIEKELAGLSERGRLVVTTTFDQTNGAALSVAANLGTRVRTLNPGSGSTYHPKVYLGRRGRRVDAVVGSANLTGGLATNVEVGVVMRGTLDDKPLATLNGWAERIWGDERSESWLPMAAEGEGDDELAPELFDALSREAQRDPVFLTLGRPARNTVTEVSRSEVLVRTGRSLRKTGQAASIPAWMFNVAWDYLRAHGELSNDTLLNHLRVMRSSAVCAMLARLPGVERAPGRAVGVRLAHRQGRT
ncbi:MAG: phospholipase D family protein [Myxococcaceae bacterium]